MSRVILKNYRIRELHFKNRVAANTSIELEQRQSFKIHYIEDRNECVGRCRIEIKPKNNELPFGISMDVEGLFTYKTGMDKGELHSIIYKELFPYIRVLINNITISAGMPPLVVRPIDIDPIKHTATPVSTIKQ